MKERRIIEVPKGKRVFIETDSPAFEVRGTYMYGGDLHLNEVIPKPLDSPGPEVTEEVFLIDLFRPFYKKVGDLCRRGHNLNGRKMSAKQVYELISEIRETVKPLLSPQPTGVTDQPTITEGEIDTNIDPMSIIKKYGLESEPLIGGQQVLALMEEYGEAILSFLTERKDNKK